MYLVRMFGRPTAHIGRKNIQSVAKGRIRVQRPYYPERCARTRKHLVRGAFRLDFKIEPTTVKKWYIRLIILRNRVFGNLVTSTITTIT